MTTPIAAVLFDMGGVVVKLDDLQNVLGPSSLSPDEVWSRWILCDSVQDFERGFCEIDDFAEAIVTELELEGTPAEFIERFVRFPQGLYDGAEDLVASVPSHIQKAVLSNTSALHWDNQLDGDVIRGLCERAYLSYELGMAKPGREIYDYAVADLGLHANQVLFIDDNQVNVDGALAAGLQAGLAKGPAHAMQVLRDLGVIT